MNKTLSFGFIALICLAGLAIAQVSLGLHPPSEGEKIFGICTYTPGNMNYIHVIQVEEPVGGGNMYREVQAKIYSDSKKCVSGYRFNFTESMLSPASNTIETIINNYIQASSLNTTISQPPGNYGTGQVSISG